LLNIQKFLGNNDSARIRLLDRIKKTYLITAKKNNSSSEKNILDNKKKTTTRSDLQALNSIKNQNSNNKTTFKLVPNLLNNRAQASKLAKHNLDDADLKILRCYEKPHLTLDHADIVSDLNRLVGTTNGSISLNPLNDIKTENDLFNFLNSDSTANQLDKPEISQLLKDKVSEIELTDVRDVKADYLNIESRFKAQLESKDLLSKLIELKQYPAAIDLQIKKAQQLAELDYSSDLANSYKFHFIQFQELASRAWEDSDLALSINDTTLRNDIASLIFKQYSTAPATEKFQDWFDLISSVKGTVGKTADFPAESVDRFPPNDPKLRKSYQNFILDHLAELTYSRHLDDSFAQPESQFRTRISKTTPAKKNEPKASDLRSFKGMLNEFIKNITNYQDTYNLMNLDSLNSAKQRSVINFLIKTKLHLSDPTEESQFINKLQATVTSNLAKVANNHDDSTVRNLAKELKKTLNHENISAVNSLIHKIDSFSILSPKLSPVDWQQKFLKYQNLSAAESLLYLHASTQDKQATLSQSAPGIEHIAKHVIETQNNDTDLISKLKISNQLSNFPLLKNLLNQQIINQINSKPANFENLMLNLVQGLKIDFNPDLVKLISTALESYQDRFDTPEVLGELKADSGIINARNHINNKITLTDSLIKISLKSADDTPDNSKLKLQVIDYLSSAISDYLELETADKLGTNNFQNRLRASLEQMLKISTAPKLIDLKADFDFKTGHSAKELQMTLMQNESGKEVISKMGQEIYDRLDTLSSFFDDIDNGNITDDNFLKEKFEQHILEQTKLNNDLLEILNRLPVEEREGIELSENFQNILETSLLPAQIRLLQDYDKNFLGVSDKNIMNSLIDSVTGEVNRNSIKPENDNSLDTIYSPKLANLFNDQLYDGKTANFDITELTTSQVLNDEDAFYDLKDHLIANFEKRLTKQDSQALVELGKGLSYENNDPEIEQLSNLLALKILFSSYDVSHQKAALNILTQANEITDIVDDLGNSYQELMEMFDRAFEEPVDETQAFSKFVSILVEKNDNNTLQQLSDLYDKLV
jgi:hypothetical protein